MTAEWDAMVTVGRIVRPHGLAGQVVVAPETDFGAERFRPGAAFVTRCGTAPRTLEVTASRFHDGRWVVAFGGVTTVDGAEALRGCDLRVAPESLRPLPAGHYYLHDLTGCLARTVDGVPIGRVERVETGTGTALLVIGTDGGEVLVPLAETICRRVDVAAGEIDIDPPDGLIELNRRR